jgi:hypothetical protein
LLHSSSSGWVQREVAMAPDPQLDDRTPPRQARAVAELAARLEIREIEVLALAHRWWFGREPETQALERTFAAYMFGGALPLWARHYAREVLGGGPIGAERAKRLGLDRLPGPVPAPRHGRFVVAATAAVFTLLLAVILTTSYDPQTSAPITPREGPLSCAGGGPGLAFLEDLAYAFAGRQRPPC